MTPVDAKVDILIVEDDENYAQRVIAPYFEDDWHIAHAYNVPQAKRILSSLGGLELALVDLDLPGGIRPIQDSGGAGFEVLYDAKERFPLARLVILTNHLTPQLVNQAQALKVEYITKGDCSTNLRRLADDLLKRNDVVNPDPALHVAEGVATECGLTDKQTEVLMLLVRAFARDDIAAELGITQWTLKSHIREIVRKTGVPKAQDLMRKIRERAEKRPA